MIFLDDLLTDTVGLDRFRLDPHRSFPQRFVELVVDATTILDAVHYAFQYGNYLEYAARAPKYVDVRDLRLDYP